MSKKNTPIMARGADMQHTPVAKAVKKEMDSTSEFPALPAPKLYDMTDMVVHEVPIAKLKFAKFQPSKRTSEPSLKAMKEAFLAGYPLNYPITIDADYNVVDGHGRAVVFMMLGAKTIPAFIRQCDQAEMFAIINGTAKSMPINQACEVYINNPKAVPSKSQHNKIRAAEFFYKKAYPRIPDKFEQVVLSLANGTLQQAPTTVYQWCKRARQLLIDYNMPVCNEFPMLRSLSLTRMLRQSLHGVSHYGRSNSKLSERGKAEDFIDMLKEHKLLSRGEVWTPPTK